MRKILLIAFIVLGTYFLARTIAQNANFHHSKKTAPNYQLAAQFSKQRLDKLVFSTQVVPLWFNDSNKFIYKYKDSNGEIVYLVDCIKGTKVEIFNLEKLANQLTALTQVPFDAQHIQMEILQFKKDRYLSFKQDLPYSNNYDKESLDSYTDSFNKIVSYIFEYDLQTKNLKEVTHEFYTNNKVYPDYAIISPDGTKGVYVKGHNLYLMDAENLLKAALSFPNSEIIETQLTNDGTHDFCWGTDNYKGDVSKNNEERIRPTSLAWSPDSKTFATIRWDMSRIQDAWVIHSLTNPRPTLETFKYQMPNEPGADGYLYLFDTNNLTHRIVKNSFYKEGHIELEYYEPSFNNLTQDHMPYVEQWLGDAEGFYLTNTSRDHKNIDLCYVSIHQDSAKIIIHEKMNTFIENKPITLFDQGKHFIQWSERNGWANIFLYQSDGTLLRNLTPGSFHVEKILGVNEKARYVVFTACGFNKKENPYHTHTYKVSLDGGDIKQLDEKNMDIQPYLSPNAKFLITNYSRVDKKPASALHNVQTGKKVMELETADFSLLLKSGYQFPEPFIVKATDGITNLYGVLYKPFDFDSSKVYPIIDYVYPGPITEANSISWNGDMIRTEQLSQLGFIVITVGNRGGHPQRSKWYHNYGYENLRDYALADHKYAIQQLSSQHSYIDSKNIGVLGHSGGGTLAATALLTYPEFYKVAVSCSGNHDNRIYSRWWNEQHNGYQGQYENQEYQVGTNQELVRNLKGHLLLVHGDQDDNVSISHSLRMVEALIKNHKRFDMLILPGQSHWYEDMDDYFFWKMADFFCLWLKGDSKQNEITIPELTNDL